jgi:aspartate beta-hydroxylase
MFYKDQPQRTESAPLPKRDEQEEQMQALVNQKLE